MELFVIGLSHKTAPVKVRERLAVGREELPLALASLVGLDELDEVVLVSTCNRTEVYSTSPRVDRVYEGLTRWFEKRAGQPIEQCLYRRRGFEAHAHLYRVAASLDSMVLGEAQILGQVKTAYAVARREGIAKARLENVFSSAFRVAKRVRTDTSVGESVVSLAFVAVDLARKVLPHIAGCTVLMVGAGKMGELAATRLRAAGAGQFHVANRSLERGARLAKLLGGTSCSLRQVPALLEKVDIVLSSTESPGFLVSKKDMATALKRRGGRPISLIDLSVPRDIDPGVACLEGVRVYDVDDLEKVVNANLEKRSVEADKAEAIIQEEVAEMIQAERARAVTSTVAALRCQASSRAESEVAKTLSRLEDMGVSKEARDSVRAMVDSIVKKLLHEPTRVLKSTGTSEEGRQLASAVVRLFDLDAGDPPPLDDMVHEEEGSSRGDGCGNVLSLAKRRQG